MVELLHKAEGETDPDFGCPPHMRPIKEHLSKGVINLDKPSGPTSHEVDSWVKRILKASKTGHGGTLDPRVTGVLPVGIDQATRVIHLLLEAPKEYVCLMRLHEKVEDCRIAEILREFQGKIFQTPPVKSAVKRELRVRNIYYVDLMELEGQNVLFRIGCQAGTYIRKYCHDVGEALGSGAHMAELRRTKVGPFRENYALKNLQELTDTYQEWLDDGDESALRETVLPMEQAAAHLPQIVIRDSAIDAISHGADLAAGGILQLSSGIHKGSTVALFSLKGELVAAGESLHNSNEICET
ncbi:MAG TPA: RNA-guided pseudouridylation complex pseudouridine synthase subunit Cbf5, partial [Methanobacterium sp.]